jgi:hypothetical protein
MNNRGVALILSFILIAVLTVLGAASLSRSISESRIARRYSESTQAFWLAEAGINRGIFELRKNYDWTGISEDKYFVTVEDLGNFRKKIISKGCVPNITSSRITRVLEVIVEKSVLPLWWAIFGDQEIKISGSAVIDSYDSSKGRYIGTPIDKDGDVGTNSIVNKSVKLTGSVIIYGDVIVGPGGDPSKVISASGSVIIDGQRLAADTVTTLPNVQVAPGLTNLGDLRLEGSRNLSLPAGSYWYSSIKISGSSSLSTSGDVTIYVDDKVEFSGSSVVGGDNQPPKLTIIVLGDEDVRFTGNNTFYGSLYAPRSEIKISGSVEAFGAVIGKEMDISGSVRFHYDKALNPTGTRQATVKVISWKDTQNPYKLVP